MSELLETLSGKLHEKFGSNLIKASMDYDFPVFLIEKNSLIEILTYLKTDPEMGFNFLTTLCGVHTPNNTGAEFGVMYQLQNMEKNWRIRLKITMPEDDLKVPTLTVLWPAANWMERQEYDFFGFNFTGHPDLRRILNMDEMNYFPMRKQYPLEDAGREDKDDKFFGR
ncbi:MAG: NADH-quinone oxidoreductase subunit C [Bacteroidia bacterium]|nr:NADH-quinone oxidoreductase subunit C [Bacteroidia bacterium]